MLVKENIEFKRGQNSKSSLDVGADSSYTRPEKLKNLESLVGTVRRDTWDEDYIIENYNMLVSMLEELHAIGVDKNRIELARKDIVLRLYSGRHHNSVNAQFLTQEDADKWVIFMKKYGATASKEAYHTDQGSSLGNYFTYGELDKILYDRNNNDEEEDDY